MGWGSLLKLEDPGGGTIPRVCLDGTTCERCRKLLELGRQSNGQMDKSRALEDNLSESNVLADPLNVSRKIEMASVDRSDDVGASSGAAGTRRDDEMMDGLGNCSDASSRHRDLPNVGIGLPRHQDQFQEVPTVTRGPQVAALAQHQVKFRLNSLSIDEYRTTSQTRSCLHGSLWSCWGTP